MDKAEAENSDASAANTFLRVSRQQLLEDFAVKDEELRSCVARQLKHDAKTKTPWWMRAIIYIATIILVIIAIWGIVALVYANRLSSGVTAARAELAAVNAEIARRLQLLDDTQRVVFELKNSVNANLSAAATAARLQQVLDTYGEQTGPQQQQQGITSLKIGKITATAPANEVGVAVPTTTAPTAEGGASVTLGSAKMVSAKTMPSAGAEQGTRVFV